METIFLFLLSFFSLQIFAQNVSIEGVAFDKLAGGSLEFSSVSLYSATNATLLSGQIADQRKI
ncbi:hypothetical protein [Pedobacter arcticus]|uniref:hypothetical protein n=1 Tax=Pedobacter arcticus TaxID=752140 RepID=UPI0012B64587|nr:hypothetical protein [Pedobacter arcticus]